MARAEEGRRVEAGANHHRQRRFPRRKIEPGFLQAVNKTSSTPQQIVIALDTAKGHITIHGWRKRTVKTSCRRRHD